MKLSHFGLTHLEVNIKFLNFWNPVTQVEAGGWGLEKPRSLSDNKANLNLGDNIQDKTKCSF